MCEDGDIFEWDDEMNITPSDEWLRRVSEEKNSLWISPDDCTEDTPRPLNPIYREMVDDCAKEQEKRMKLKRSHLYEENINDGIDSEYQRRPKLKCVERKGFGRPFFMANDLKDFPSCKIDMNDANSLHIHNSNRSHESCLPSQMS